MPLTPRLTPKMTPKKMPLTPRLTPKKRPKCANMGSIYREMPEPSGLVFRILSEYPGMAKVPKSGVFGMYLGMPKGP